MRKHFHSDLYRGVGISLNLFDSWRSWAHSRVQVKRLAKTEPFRGLSDAKTQVLKLYFLRTEYFYIVTVLECAWLRSVDL